MNKLQKNKEILFRSQYLYLTQELLENALYFKKDYNNVLFIDNGFFSSKVYKKIKTTLPKSNIDTGNVNNLSSLNVKNYDLIIAPMAIQFMPGLKDSFKRLNSVLAPDGIILASGFNVLSSSDSILKFKEEILKKKLKASLVNIFDLGTFLNSLNFVAKSLDRENIILINNKVEVINLYVQKVKKVEEGMVKIVIS